MAAVIPIAWLEIFADVSRMGDSDAPAAFNVHHAGAQRRGRRFTLVLTSTGFPVVTNAPLPPGSDELAPSWVGTSAPLASMFSTDERVTSRSDDDAMQAIARLAV